MRPCIWCGGAGEFLVNVDYRDPASGEYATCLDCEGTGISRDLPEPPGDDDPPDPENEWEWSDSGKTTTC